MLADPVCFPRRYPDPADAELAGVFAASLAFGRVDLFRHVIAEILAAADQRGGPRRWVEHFEPDRDGAALRPLIYRWIRGPDLVLLACVLQQVIREHDGIEPLFELHHGESDIEQALTRGIATLRHIAVDQAHRIGAKVTSYTDLPRSFRYLLPSPASGSACKRWCMYLRWMCRPDDGVDMGLWSCVPPSKLIIPLDTHVSRIARLIGLTQRKTDGWRTAREITHALAAIDPADPVRFDFALAHLGISGRCRGINDANICPSCPLEPLCVA